MKFYSKPVAEHCEVPVADDGQLELLIDKWIQRENQPEDRSSESNQCYVVALVGEGDAVGQLGEILSLVKTQGDDIVGSEVVRMLKHDPRTLLGKGKSMEVAERARAAGADLLVIDAELSPSQMRNLEDVTGISVCDREAVILNVFRRNARTRRARIQVEIAHLEYLRPRIRGLGLDMDQQAAGVITGRGPGETASAMLARKLDGRLLELKKGLSKIKQTASVQRAGRASCKQVALVGYTNAGKTSLMNALTGVSLSARNRPFETLDTTTRNLSCHGGQVVLSDTVGFIRRLPDRLFESFESTLDGILDASLLVIVVDVSDIEKELHLKTTLSVLKKLGADSIPKLFVFNKRDLLNEAVSNEEKERLCQGSRHVTVSSKDRDAVMKLRETILGMVRSDQVRTRLFVPYSAKDAFDAVYKSCRVLKTDAKEKGLLLSIEGEGYLISRIRKAISEVKNA